MSEKETDHAATYIIMISIDHKKSINNFTKNGYRQANKPLENHRKSNLREKIHYDKDRS